MVRGKLLGTGISVEQRRGTSPRPIARADAAGKSEVRSLVTVKMTDIKSSALRLLARINSSMSSTTASCINPASSRSIWVAPLIPLTLIRRFYFLRAHSCRKWITRLTYLSVKRFYFEVAQDLKSRHSCSFLSPAIENDLSTLAILNERLFVDKLIFQTFINSD